MKYTKYLYFVMLAIIFGLENAIAVSGDFEPRIKQFSPRPDTARNGLMPLLVAGTPVNVFSNSEILSMKYISHKRWLRKQILTTHPDLNAEVPRVRMPDLNSELVPVTIPKSTPINIPKSDLLTTSNTARFNRSSPAALFAQPALNERYLAFFDPDDFVGKTILTTLDSIEKAGLTNSALASTPWSDSYWPTYRGGIANRYASTDFNALDDFDTRLDYIKNKAPYFSTLSSGLPAQIDELSPAEKYDFLTSTRSVVSQPLTNAVWTNAQRYRKPDGNIETWMGICHGWAPASYMLDRPEKSVIPLESASSQIKFYPSDIKALASYAWAQNRTGARYLGARCNDKEVERDPDSGRIIKNECFDTNPSNWHFAVINQIGVAQRGFVMDATYDYQVWNQPVYSYSVAYFNPITRVTTKDWRSSVVLYSDFASTDVFKKYRNNPKYIVGVNMTISYVLEVDPSHEETNSAKQDSVRTVQYDYDLELDSSETVLGGEWYTTNHPDFLWNTLRNSKAQSYYEKLSAGGPQWDPLTQALPDFWKDIAQRSAGLGQPALFIVNGLISSTRSEPNTR
jgi:Transglutaminase elicitor